MPVNTVQIEFARNCVRHSGHPSSCRGVRVVGVVRSLFIIMRIQNFRFATSKAIRSESFAIIFFQNIPVHPYKPYSNFISFTYKREKKMLLALLHFLHYCPIDQSAKMQKCKVQAVCCVALWRDGQDLTVQIPFPSCSLLASSFQRLKEPMMSV